MKDRIIKNPITTLIGLVIVAACFFLVYKDKASWIEIAPFLTMALPFFFLKDEKPGNTGGGAALLVILAIAFCSTMLGCTKVIPLQTTRSDSTYTRVLNQQQVVRGERVVANADLDSLRRLLVEMRAKGLPASVAYRNSATSPTILKIQLDSAGKLNASCEVLDQVIQYLIEETRRVSAQNQAVLQEPEETARWPVLQNYIVAGAILALLAFTIYIVSKKAHV